MVLFSRREAGKLLLTGCAGALVAARGLRSAERINSMVRGVQIGAQSYSFRDRPLDACIDAFRECGLGECELSELHVQPPSHNYEELKKWRLETPMSSFKIFARSLIARGFCSTPTPPIFKAALPMKRSSDAFRWRKR